MLQNPILFPKQPATRLVTDDTDIGLKVKYVGSEPSATVTVSDAGDITFKHGELSSEAVDDTIKIGSNDGVIDVSNAAGNTFGEVVDHINSSPNWRAFIVDALREDNANASTGSLLAREETTIIPNTDLELFKDSSKVLNLSVRIGVRELTGGSEEKGAAEVYGITSVNTYTGTSKIQIYEINEATNSEKLIYEVAGGATTVEQSLAFVVNGRGSLGVHKQGNHLLVRMIGSAAATGKLMVIGAVAKGL